MTGEELLQRKLKWEKTPDAFHPMRTEVDGQELRIRVGDFPEESLYTLLAGDQELAQFDDWPKTWQRPPSDKSAGFYGKSRAAKTTRHGK
ncbi:hypothetical protein D187_009191 [Cystobacter fuscus DSM 2262]|uniref:Uncharacterized protein n=1 Tax=Cystobacter fuscus (strain ATCC 25194 / DSM 2262 / NBRC 100088 / M29) TaxID=1242864 RepID=S9NTW8_CYSF2|nr:hypothetical protein [Cystobacter fuscus]EPX55580.1 hypothetical protein D187_009191 [Cystobacter fuscus DSM 2262]